MINEPRYWKRDIARTATALERCLHQVQWREGSYAKLEKIIMLGFYSARKLIEGEWVDRRLRNEPVIAVAYPCRNRRLLATSYQHVEEAYDLDRPAARKPPLQFICNQIVHSFIFTPAFRGNHLSALYFCSYDKRDYVYRVEIAELIRVLLKTSSSRHPVLFRFVAEVNRLDES